MTLVLSVTSEVFSKENKGEGKYEAILRSVARPRLIFPDNQAIELSRRKTLIFEWGLTAHPLVALDYIEFYLYKGGIAKKKNLVFRRRLGSHEYSIEIDSRFFDNGQFYMWGIRQFYLKGEQSNESSTLFRVYR